MLTLSNKETSVSGYCERGDYESAAQALTGWRGIGIRPARDGASDAEFAERLQWAAIITVELSLKKQIPIGDSARDMLSESARLSQSVVPLVWLGTCYHRCGEYGESSVILESCLERDIDPASRFLALRNLAVVRECQGRYDAALDLISEAEQWLGHASLVSRGKLYLESGLVHRLRNELDKAVAEYEKADQYFEDAGNVNYEGAVSLNLAHVFLQKDDYLNAHVRAQRAVSIFQSLGDKLHCAQAWDEIARIYLAENKLENAERAARQAIALVEGGDQGQVLAECLITHGTILGKRAFTQASESLERASAICANLGDEKQMHAANEQLARIYKDYREVASVIAAGLGNIERRVIKESLTKHSGVLSKVATDLGIPYEALRKKISSQFPDLSMERCPIKRRKSVLSTKPNNSHKRAG